MTSYTPVSYTPEEIEKSRLDALSLLKNEDENGNVYDLFDTEQNLPGTFGYHEAFHTSLVIRDLVESKLADHPAILLDPEAYRLAHEAYTTLFNLYSHMGSKHL